VTLAEIFIRRRTGTILLAVGAMLIGMVAYFLLPVAPLPQVEFPTIQVSASLPGASAETMATSVATPLERSFSSIPGLTGMSSSSSLGTTSVALEFDLNKSIDVAAQDVQTAINAAAGNLPKNLPNPPTYRKTNPADVTMLSLALTSDTLPLTELSRYADEYVGEQISRMPGVGIVSYLGLRRPAVRVRLDLDRIAELGLTLEDVRQTLAVQTVNAPKGSLNSADRTIVLDATDQLLKAKDYPEMVIAYREGAPVRLKDVGTVEEAPEDVRQGAWLNTKPTVMIDIHKQPGFNVVNTIAGIKSILPQIIATLPPSCKLMVAGDRTQTIRSSVNDVQWTMILTVLLVVLVIYAFLRNLRATIISSITIPLSVIVTFAFMYALGYSLDNLSLMGLTIAVSFVVDDAIVVIENIARHLEEGATRVEAAIKGSREIVFTVISMTISLIAVFIPILFMSGIIGRLFREFAITVSIALLISAVVSLTLTPMLCAWLLEYLPEEEQGRFHRGAERIFTRLHDAYRAGLDRVLRHPSLMLGVTVATVALTAYLYVIIPKGFFPQQDAGVIAVVFEGAPDIGYDAMTAQVRKAAGIIAKDPDVDSMESWLGPNPTLSNGRAVINLKPFDERHSSGAQTMSRLQKATADIEGLTLHMQMRQEIQIGARAAKTQYQYTLQDADVDELSRWASILQKRFAMLPQLQDVSSDAEKAASSATLEIDRTTASRLGVSVQAIDDALYDAFGQRQVATLFTQLDQYHVIEEAATGAHLSRETLDHLYVRSSITQQLVPLSMAAKFVPGVLPIAINHQGTFPSITLSFNLAPGASLGDAVDVILATELASGMPRTVTGSFQGTAQAFQDSLRSQPYLILAALIAVYIVLGVLYESAIHPLTIISTLPSAGVGALLALILFNQDLSIMGIIGIILLIGIVKKNAIMMIDFALAAQREGLSPEEAIQQGALLRFRPIIMTTAAALFGALPLALGLGAGAELRRPLGIAIAGGLVVSQALTLFSTPVIHLWFERLSARIRRSASIAPTGMSLQGMER
jgi:multidrug efflux pump